MAEVAPHPFTTIEPNIGPGWFSGPRDNKYDKGRVTAYGRDSTDRRLLPVLIKDVAGLVPGAYKGRGKGTNRYFILLTWIHKLYYVSFFLSFFLSFFFLTL